MVRQEAGSGGGDDGGDLLVELGERHGGDLFIEAEGDHAMHGGEEAPGDQGSLMAGQCWTQAGERGFDVGEGGFLEGGVPLGDGFAGGQGVLKEGGPAEAVDGGVVQVGGGEGDELGLRGGVGCGGGHHLVDGGEGATVDAEDDAGEVWKDGVDCADRTSDGFGEGACSQSGETVCRDRRFCGVEQGGAQGLAFETGCGARHENDVHITAGA